MAIDLPHKSIAALVAVMPETHFIEIPGRINKIPLILHSVACVKGWCSLWWMYRNMPRWRVARPIEKRVVRSPGSVASRHKTGVFVDFFVTDL